MSRRPYVTKIQPGKAHVSKKTLISDILANFSHFRWPNLAETVKRHIYRPRPFIWAYSQVSTAIRHKETAWKSLCFEKPLFLDILAKFGHFRWPNLAKTVKRHIYRSRPFIWAYSTTIRYKVTAWKRIDDGRTDEQTDRRADTPNLLR